MSEMTIDDASRIEIAIARSHVYGLLARGFRYPDQETYAALRDTAYVAALAQAIETCEPDGEASDLQSLASALAIHGTREEFEAGYISAFETNMPVPSVSLYEGSHCHPGNRPSLLLELKAFYANFGLTIDESHSDLEDALAVELEFMQFLVAKQVLAEQGELRATPYLRAQQDFLQRHLANWLPRLAADAGTKLPQAFHLRLIQAASEFVAGDANRL